MRRSQAQPLALAHIAQEQLSETRFLRNVPVPENGGEASYADTQRSRQFFQSGAIFSRLGAAGRSRVAPSMRSVDGNYDRGENEGQPCFEAIQRG